MEPPREESAALLRSLANVNKQLGAGGGEDGGGCSPAQVLKFTCLLFCIVDFFPLRLIALIYFMRALMLNIIWC